MNTRLQRRSPRSAHSAVVAATLGLGAALVACGPRQAPRSAAPAAAVSTSRPVGGPPAPRGGLAFPSLAVGSTKALLEDLWDDAGAMSHADADAVLRARLGATSAFYKHFVKLRGAMR